jgi:hypothetical protein
MGGTAEGHRVVGVDPDATGHMAVMASFDSTGPVCPPVERIIATRSGRT